MAFFMLSSMLVVWLLDIHCLVDRVMDEHDERGVRFRSPRVTDVSAPRPGAAVRVVRILVEPLDQFLEVHFAIFDSSISGYDLTFEESVQILPLIVDPSEGVACIGTR